MKEFWIAFVITAATMVGVGMSRLNEALPGWAWPWGLIPFFWLVFVVVAWMRRPTGE